MYSSQFLTLIGKLNETLTDLRINTILVRMLQRDGDNTDVVVTRRQHLEHTYNRIQMFLTYNFNDEYTNYCNELREMCDDNEDTKQV